MSQTIEGYFAGLNFPPEEWGCMQCRYFQRETSNILEHQQGFLEEDEQ